MATPGMTALKTTAEGSVLLSQIEASFLLGVTIDGAARDVGNTGYTTTLRPGLICGRKTTGKKVIECIVTATDGSEVPIGVLPHATKVIDKDAANEDQPAVLVTSGLVKASALIGLNETIRVVMRSMGFIFDDELEAGSVGYHEPVVAKTADYTVLATDNGKIFTNRAAAGAVNFTLPTLAKGLRFKFFAEADQNLTVTAAAADTMVVYNDAAADSVSWQTASNKIGGGFEVIANDNASKWLVFVYPGQTSDGTATGQRVTIST